MPIVGGTSIPERAVVRDRDSKSIIKMRLQPAAPGTVVRDDETGRLLGAAGGLVPNNTYWRRRLADGSAVPAPAETARAKDKDEKKKEEAES